MRDAAWLAWILYSLTGLIYGIRLAFRGWREDVDRDLPGYGWLLRVLASIGLWPFFRGLLGKRSNTPRRVGEHHDRRWLR